MSRRWRRVGPWTLRTAGGTAGALLGAGLAGALGYAVLVLGWPLPLAAPGWGVLLLWVGYWWRVALVGVFVDEHSIRVRSVGRTRTFAAVDVLDVRVRARSLAAGGAAVRVRELCFDLLTGRGVSTSVHGDAREGRGHARLSVLSAAVFDMVVDRLRRFVAEAEPPPEPPPDEPEPPAAKPVRRSRRARSGKPPPGIIEWR